MAEPAKDLSALPNVSSITRESTTAELIATRDDLFVKQAYQTLHVAFTALPILAGLDKYFNVLANWTDYLSPLAIRATGLAPPTFMAIVGVIEIAAGIGVAIKPKVFAWVVAGWLCAIVANLLTTGAFGDIALRDLGLALAALALARLSPLYERGKIVHRVR